MPPGAVGAIVGAARHRQSLSNDDADMQRRKSALEDLHVREADNVWVYDQSAPERSHQLRVPRAFRLGEEARGKISREAVLQWLSHRLSRNVTDVGIVYEESPGHPAVLAFFSDRDIEIEGSPFREGARLVVVCNGDTPDNSALAKIGKPPPAIVQHSLSMRSERSESAAKRFVSEVCVIT
eukprot:TRINITY_DN98176_c0_g1_i1.p1 TRINITY_DN98176_c0_g1~~TRINITY_DN98176_c0_g1_i1.p1  ORF type:complete len:181 (-),score=27.54 TRINITY_DN98176_c0_g1_i1:141-683(-)